MRVVSVAGLVLSALASSKPANVVWTPPGELRAVVLGRDSVPLPGVTVSLAGMALSAAVQRSAVTTGQGTSREMRLKFRQTRSAPRHSQSVGPHRAWDVSET